MTDNPNPKDPQAELRTVILHKLLGEQIDSEECYVDTKAKFVIDDVIELFQAHQQQLLTELYKIGTASTEENHFNPSDAEILRKYDDLMTAIERLQNKTNDGGRDGDSD